MARLTIADLEIERPDEPLELEMPDGSIYELQDPRGVPVHLMVSIETLPPLEQVKALIADGKWDAFVQHPEVDGYYFEAVMKLYVKHFGLGDLGKGSGSPPSSNGTAKRSRPTSRGRVTPSPRSGKPGAGGSSPA